MARSFEIANLINDKGLIVSNALARAYKCSNHSLIETQYSDSSGDINFVALGDTDDVYIIVTWGQNVKWFYSEAPPTIDEVRDGTTFAKVYIEDLTTDHIHLGSAKGDSDDVKEGSSHKWDTGVPPTILDQLANGDYGKVLAEDIDITSHHVKLSATLESASANYVTNNEKTGASDGYNFFETKLTAYGLSIKSSAGSTRIELTASHIAGYSAGVLQFEIKASDGKAYFGGGTIVADATGLTFNDGYNKKICLKYPGINDAYMQMLTTGGMQISCVDGIALPKIKNTYLEADLNEQRMVGKATNRWLHGHFKYLGDSTHPVDTIYADDIIATTIKPATDGSGALGASNKIYNYLHAKAAYIYTQALLNEVAASPSNIAGKAQLYSKDTNLLYCRTGDGIEHTVAFA